MHGKEALKLLVVCLGFQLTGLEGLIRWREQSLHHFACSTLKEGNRLHQRAPPDPVSFQFTIY